MYSLTYIGKENLTVTTICLDTHLVHQSRNFKRPHLAMEFEDGKEEVRGEFAAAELGQRMGFLLQAPMPPDAARVAQPFA